MASETTVNQNSEVTRTWVLLPIGDRALMARNAWLKHVDEHAFNLGFAYSFKKHRKMKKWFETQCLELHIVLYDNDSHDVNSVDLFCEHMRKVLGENVPEDTVANSSV